jgi:hypothetical protein
MWRHVHNARTLRRRVQNARTPSRTEERINFMKLRRLVLLSLLTLGMLFVFAPASFGQSIPGRTPGPYSNIGEDPCAGMTNPDDCMNSAMGSAVNMTCRAQLGVPATYCWTSTYDGLGNPLPKCARAPVTSGGCTCAVTNGKVNLKGSCTSY